MLEYKGFDIPETKEEMISRSRLTTVSCSLPAVILHASDKNDNLRLTTRVTIEDLTSMSEIDAVNEFKKIIDAFRGTNNG